jgi:23S rRNA (guanosine2251-2'-O)-methyltransferase
MNRKLKLWELSRLSQEEFKEKKKFPITVVLDNIRSFSNVGTFFRTGDSFAIEQIILCGITPLPPHREIHKTALGATESVTWTYAEDTAEICKQMQQNGFQIHVLEQAEKTTYLQEIEIDSNKKYALVFGNEVDGVDQAVIDMANAIVEIPQFGTKHSLNVSVCAGVTMWEYVKKMMCD